ncbi:MAG: hypothetical protein AB7Q29_18685 [Vicinamibacterales bacterium]
MTTAAWIMLVFTWSVVIFFTGRFFLLVLRTPMHRRGDDASGPAT